MAFLPLLSAAIAFASDGNQHQASPRNQSDELLDAAEQRDWERARVLLAQGVDPNVTAFTSFRPVPEPYGRVRYTLDRLSPLSQAAAQGNGNAVTLLLRYNANVNIRAPLDPGPLIAAVQAGQTETARLLLAVGADVTVRRASDQSVVQIAQSSGKHDLIRLIEGAARVPTYKRAVPQVPFADGARENRPHLVPGTIGAIPLRHLLWVSAHDLLILREGPRRFVQINVETGQETELPEFSKRWSAQKMFDPDMLTLSPDGKWLLGFGGTNNKATWVAAQVHGDGWREWHRLHRPNAPDVIQRNPLIAWMDGRRWVELNRSGPSYVARVRTRGNAHVRQLPLTVPTYLDDFPSMNFVFPNRTEGRLNGLVGTRNRPGDDYNGPCQFVTRLIRVLPGRTRWHVTQREVAWEQTQYPGYFHRCAPSPRSEQLAWLNVFSGSHATAILTSDADGKNARILYEHLYRIGDFEKGLSESPWHNSLEWTPRGDGLAFWRGQHGKNGLCLLPVPATRSQPVPNLRSRTGRI